MEDVDKDNDDENPPNVLVISSKPQRAHVLLDGIRLLTLPVLFCWFHSYTKRAVGKWKACAEDQSWGWCTARFYFNSTHRSFTVVSNARQT